MWGADDFWDIVERQARACDWQAMMHILPVANYIDMCDSASRRKGKDILSGLLKLSASHAPQGCIESLVDAVFLVADDAEEALAIFATVLDVARGQGQEGGRSASQAGELIAALLERLPANWRRHPAWLEDEVAGLVESQEVSWSAIKAACMLCCFKESSPWPSAVSTVKRVLTKESEHEEAKEAGALGLGDIVSIFGQQEVDASCEEDLPPAMELLWREVEAGGGKVKEAALESIARCLVSGHAGSRGEDEVEAASRLMEEAARAGFDELPRASQALGAALEALAHAKRGVVCKAASRAIRRCDGKEVGAIAASAARLVVEKPVDGREEEEEALEELLEEIGFGSKQREGSIARLADCLPLHGGVGERARGALSRARGRALSKQGGDCLKKLEQRLATGVGVQREGGGQSDCHGGREGGGTGEVGAGEGM